MCLSDTNKKLITTLKGKISKLLGVNIKLSAREKEGLIRIYDHIDSFLTGKAFETLESFQLSLHECSSKSLEDSKKKYIKEEIIPLIKSINSKGN